MNVTEIERPKHHPKLDENAAFKIDKRFSIILNMNYQGMFACGQNASHRSFLDQIPVRTPNVGYNVESAFYATLNMLHKTVKFEYLPMERLTVGETEIYYYGERNGGYQNYIIEGDINSDKFVVYYIRRGIVVGLLTFGYTNLHIYLIEAMKRLMLPTGKE